ncbi:hypothetical protein JMJ77_0011695, partial [Colletotrichum scovillei]
VNWLSQTPQFSSSSKAEPLASLTSGPGAKCNTALFPAIKVVVTSSEPPLFGSPTPNPSKCLRLLSMRHLPSMALTTTDRATGLQMSPPGSSPSFLLTSPFPAIRMFCVSGKRRVGFAFDEGISVPHMTVDF